MTTFQEQIEFLSASSATILSKLSELSHLKEQVRQAQACALNRSNANRNFRAKRTPAEKSDMLSLSLAPDTLQIRGTGK